MRVRGQPGSGVDEPFARLRRLNWLSTVLFLVAVTAIGISLALTRLLTRVSGPQFAAQWRETGNLNSTVEESFTGQTLIQVFGARKRI